MMRHTPGTNSPFAKGYFGGTVLGDESFFYHFWSYVIVNVILVAVNLLTTPDILWFYWPLLGWGIGLLAHGLAVNYSAEERVRRRSRTRGPQQSA